MAICDYKLNTDIQANCDNPAVGGYRQFGYIINKDDIKTFPVIDPEGDGGVEVGPIALKTGAKAFSLQQLGAQPYKTTKTLVKGANYNRFNSSVSLVALEHNLDFYNKVIEPLFSGSRFVVILENEFDGEGIPSFQVYGYEKGLSIADGSGREEYNADTDGGWVVNLEETGASIPSYCLVDTDGAGDRASIRKELDLLLKPQA